MTASDLAGLILFGGFGLWLILLPNTAFRFYYLFYRSRVKMPKPSTIHLIGIGWLIFLISVMFFARHLPVYVTACESVPFSLSPDADVNTETAMEIRVDDLSGSEIIALLHEHLRCMALVSPPESRHALDLDGLRKPDVTFWTIWDGSDLAGCGAIKELDDEHAEIKSMRTAYAYQRKGVGSQVLRHLIDEAKRRGYRRVSLETGSMEYFAPARSLYASFGFEYCGPFGSYTEDSNSIFMTKELDS